ncbi:hypothetical protein [Pseudomonas helvetica]
MNMPFCNGLSGKNVTFYEYVLGKRYTPAAEVLQMKNILGCIGSVTV